MTSDRNRRPVRWLALLLPLAVLCAGCEDSGAKKSDPPPDQPKPQLQPLQPKHQKAGQPSTYKME